MALYRARRKEVLMVEDLGREVVLDPSIPIDDEDPEGAAIVKRWGNSHLRADSIVEAATAAPGEARATRRPEVAA